MKLFKKVLLTVALFLAALFGIGTAVSGLNEMGFFNLAKTDVYITNSSFQPHYINPLILEVDQIINEYKGISLWRLDLPQIAERVLAKNWVRDVKISRHWPSQLYVYVQIKEVKLLLYGRAGKIFPVTKEGELLSAINLKTLPDLPLLSGDIFEHNWDLRKKAIQLISEIPQKGSFSAKTISEVFYDAKDGFSLRMMKSGLKIKIGEDQFVIKGARLNQVLEYLESKSMQAALVDANLSKKVLVRLKKSNQLINQVFE